MTRIDYRFADDSFMRIRLSRLPKEVAKELVKYEQKEAYQHKKDCVFRHGKGYQEGESETHMREISYSDPVADAADDNELTAMMRDAVQQLSPTQQRRIWLYAQGYTYLDIACLEGISKTAAHNSIKGAKKKLKIILEKGLTFSSVF